MSLKEPLTIFPGAHTSPQGRKVIRRISYLTEMNQSSSTVHFAPELIIPAGTKDLSFYQRAFDAIEVLCFRNEDDSIHVVEFNLNGATFHVHEETNNDRFFSPARHSGSSVCIGLFVQDVDAFMQKALEAGAKEINPPEDHDYGYRQGMLLDPFGHYWQIQKKI